MSNEEVKWLKQVKKYPNRFKIVVDSDSVWVEDHVEDEWKFDFNSYGVEFIHDVLNQLGYNTEYC